MNSSEELDKQIKELDEQIEEAQKLVRSLKSKKINAERDAARKCHWCGKSDDDNYDDGYGGLVDFHLEVSVGEEGYSNIVRYACQEHLVWLADEFNKLGFYNHYHGSTTFIEALDCPGYNDMDACPTPEDPWEIKVWPT
jgi:hypothetical protein